MKKNKLAFVCILFFIAWLLSGCGNGISPSPPEEEQKAYRIGVLIYRFDDSFITSLIDEIKSEAEVLNETSSRKITLVFMDGNNQQDIQNDQMDQLIKENYDAIAVNLVNRSSAASVIDKAKEAGIPIVFFNRQPVKVDMARWNQIYYVGSEAEKSGVMQGEIVSDYWEEHPEADKNADGIMQYVLLEGQPDHQDAILRSEYSIKTIKDGGIQVQELIRDTGNWQRSEAKDLMMNWLLLFNDEIEMVLSNNDAMVLGAVDAMKENKTDLIPAVGIDGIAIAIDALKAGEIVGTILNDNVEQGRRIMDIAYYLAADQDPTDYMEDIEEGKYCWVAYKKITE